MHGALALHRGTLFVGRHAKTAHLDVFDLDGRRLPGGFSFRSADGRSSADGVAVDDDRQVWLADGAAGKVRVFTLFGRELGELGRDSGGDRDVDSPAVLAAPTAVAVDGDRDGARVLVGQSGERRHAAQVFDEQGALLGSLRPLGDRHGRFRNVSGVALAGRFAWVAEAGAGRVQVFRDLDFHFAFDLQARGEPLEPRALAALPDGRLVVAAGGPRGREAEGSLLVLLESSGREIAVLARGGEDEGRLDEPNDVVVEPGRDDRDTRVAVIDREGERVQVLNLEGRVYGSFDPGAREERLEDEA